MEHASPTVAYLLVTIHHQFFHTAWFGCTTVQVILVSNIAGKAPVSNCWWLPAELGWCQPFATKTRASMLAICHGYSSPPTPPKIRWRAHPTDRFRTGLKPKVPPSNNPRSSNIKQPQSTIYWRYVWLSGIFHTIIIINPPNHYASLTGHHHEQHHRPLTINDCSPRSMGVAFRQLPWLWRSVGLLRRPSRH